MREFTPLLSKQKVRHGEDNEKGKQSQGDQGERLGGGMPLEVEGPNEKSGVLGTNCARKRHGVGGQGRVQPGRHKPGQVRAGLTWEVLSAGFFITAWRKLLST